MKNLFGTNQSKAKGQFRINPNLQRTQASGDESGFELGTEIPKYKVIQDGIVTLPNRAVPRNLNQTPNKKRVVRFDTPSLQGVPKSRK